MRLKVGDRNFKYLHAKALARKRKNEIGRLQNDDGEWQDGIQMKKLIVNYFQSLFTSSKELGSMEFLHAIEGRVLDQMNSELSKDLIAKEIDVAMK